MTVFRQAVRVARQVNAATARLGPEVPPAQVAHRAKVEQPARRVDRAAMLVLADGPAVRAVNSRAAVAPRGPEVPLAREALPDAVVPLALVVLEVRAARQAQAAAPEREA